MSDDLIRELRSVKERSAITGQLLPHALANRAADALAAQQAEIARLRVHPAPNIERIRRAALDEAAKVADTYCATHQIGHYGTEVRFAEIHTAQGITAAIRALIDKEPT